MISTATRDILAFLLQDKRQVALFAESGEILEPRTTISSRLAIAMDLDETVRLKVLGHNDRHLGDVLLNPMEKRPVREIHGEIETVLRETFNNL